MTIETEEEERLLKYYRLLDEQYKLPIIEFIEAMATETNDEDDDFLPTNGRIIEFPKRGINTPWKP